MLTKLLLASAIVSITAACSSDGSVQALDRLKSDANAVAAIEKSRLETLAQQGYQSQVTPVLVTQSADNIATVTYQTSLTSTIDLLGVVTTSTNIVCQYSISSAKYSFVSGTTEMSSLTGLETTKLVDGRNDTGLQRCPASE